MISAALRYDPYGQTVASAGSVPSPWRFQGRLDLMANPADPLYEWSARTYLPTTGAFSQLDAYPGSVGDPRSLNRYLYAAANPWTLVDPSGHAFMSGLEAEESELAVMLPAPGPGESKPVVHVISTPHPRFSTPAWTDSVRSWQQFAEHPYNFYVGLRGYATGLSSLLREGSSLAGSELPTAGALTRYGRSGAFRLLGRGILAAGIPLEYWYQREQGHGELEALVRTGVVTASSFAGVVAGTGACAGGAVASSGAGAVLCPALVVGGGIGGAWVGDRLLEVFDILTEQATRPIRE